jgi:alkylation response protein AidB-like acyl-CoA dehydrogenase
MDFDLGKEQVMLQKSARDFLKKECPKDLVRDMMEDEKGYSPKLWDQMTDLGWQGLVIPEPYDGIGSSFLDLVVLIEEMGRALLPGPFIPTVVYAGRPILAVGSDEQKKRYLPAIANGEMIMSLALAEASGRFDAAGIAVTAAASGENFVINGTKFFVPDAHIAHYLIVAARTREEKGGDGISLFLVDTQSKGVEVEVLTTMSGEKQCEVVFRDVAVPRENLLGPLDAGGPVLQDMLDEAIIAECAFMMGGARWVLEESVGYAKERKQFDVPIGTFQAIQHKLANVAVDVEGATSIVYYAAWAVDEKDPGKTLAASAAKAWCSDIYTRTAFEGIQIHGGMGFTWEHDMHLYLKAAKSSQVAFGGGDFHRERVAGLLDI